MKKRAASDLSFQSEFESFVNTEIEVPSASVSRKILAKVKSDLEFMPGRFFVKILTAHGISGVVSLFVCQQFGIQWGNHKTLYSLFHSHLGHEGCMVACGALFMAAGSLTLAPFLSEGEARWFRMNAFVLSSVLAAVTLFLLSGLGTGADVFSYMYWLSGATGASYGIVHLIARFRIGSRLAAAQ